MTLTVLVSILIAVVLQVGLVFAAWTLVKVNIATLIESNKNIHTALGDHLIDYKDLVKDVKAIQLYCAKNSNDCRK